MKSDDFARKVTIENSSSLDIIIGELVADALVKFCRYPEDVQAIARYLTGQK